MCDVFNNVYVIFDIPMSAKNFLEVHIMQLLWICWFLFFKFINLALIYSASWSFPENEYLPVISWIYLEDQKYVNAFNWHS